MLIVPDLSTRLAALRTGKLDQLSTVILEDAKSLKATNPKLQYFHFPPTGGSKSIYARLDKPTLPFYDIRVRKALMLAIDYDTIVQSYYSGEAIKNIWPLAWGQTKRAYLGIDDPDCPKEVKELYSYDTDKAKQLLKEAGYPNGFKTHMIVLSGPEIDYMSIIKDQWQKIGVELILDPKESGTYTTIGANRNMEEMIYYGGGCDSSHFVRGIVYSGTTRYNQGHINETTVDPIVAKAQADMRAAYYKLDLATAEEIHREFMKYVLPQVWAIPVPQPYNNNFWQPWLKNYYGVMGPGYMDSFYWTKYTWVDQDLKKSMGY
jgi:peptide/nickel transport system substrate-binding protein